MHFVKLRVSGFKSFVEPTELYIEPGMTGIVGPNGCGKSNVVEALKWVMGETSARQMRGSEMDDVIFGGSVSRPARNIAEVVLHLDNTDRTAPPQFNHETEIEISRRIERNSGSTYRLNGREVRARDVQLLFADLATGAHSTAIVTQGRVGALIGAKPTERRMLLEEAAGITGLHSRRHEAELRLRAAETNLERLDDVVAALEGQYQGLQRQARQAARYRRLADQIRHNEAALLYRRWTEATEAVMAASARMREAESAVAERTRIAADAATAQADAATALPPLRQAEVEAAAELQRLQLAERELQAEERRVADAQADIARRLAQVAGDGERELSLLTDATTALQRLAEERAELERAQDGETEAQQAAGAALQTVRNELRSLEGDLAQLTERVAAAEARRTGLERQQAELARRRERIAARMAETAAERDRLAASSAADAAVEAAQDRIGQAEAALAAAQTSRAEAETAREAAMAAEQAARDAAQQTQSRVGALEAEAKALAKIAEPAERDMFAPVLDAMTVEPGYETALGAALGDEVEAPTDTAAKLHWATLDPLAAPPALPPEAEPLARYVEGPAALARRMALIGVVADTATGRRLQPGLQPGQRLVTRDGALWRWDGYTMTAGAPSAAAIRLEQRNRLREVRASLAGAQAEAQAAVKTLAARRDTAQAAAVKERDARTAMDAAFRRLNELRAEHARLTAAAAGTRSRIASLGEALAALAREAAEAEAEAGTLTGALAEIEDVGAARSEIESRRADIGGRRAVEAERRSQFDRLAREAEDRRRRLARIAEEERSWRERVGGAEARVRDIDQRRSETEAERDRLADRPAEIGEQRRKLLTAIGEAEARRAAAADRLAEGEARQTASDSALRSAEAGLAEAREDRVRCEAQVEQTRNDRIAVAERVRERLDCPPDRILQTAGIEDPDTLPDRETVERRIEQLGRERDSIGPVNLRAEAELADLTNQIEGMRNERADLIAAIARLRQGIGALNREGRERLLTAFERVNEHFTQLFTQLFGGGRAHLTLTEAEDPLQSGLEIMASPPGKKLQTMSLLSGGEQALTAIALLFAVFLTNPAPICILDEVDAPLDDANVDRFCTLLSEIAHSGLTRFLVVTHHRLTMARMDRLFGVTMGERGVSQLVSVDLRRAERLRESA
ncbi:MAG: chromosome segregation protein SMC [Alphaproteobacteria bacterium]